MEKLFEFIKGRRRESRREILYKQFRREKERV
jgi:hypothetical protein